MILTKEIEIIVNSRVVPYYRNLGYNTGANKKILIPTEHLNNGSHANIKVKCDKCGYENIIKYKTYLMITKYDGLYYCRKNKCFTDKVKKTTTEKYGVSNTSKLKDKQDKWKETNLEKYGVENTFQSEIIKEKIKQYYRDNYDGAEWNTQVKEIRDKNGWIPDEDLEGFSKYRRIVRKLTRRNKKELFEKWNGYDYYDGDYIKDNFILDAMDRDYPTIDHKISLKHGYINNFNAEDVASIDNICITKRHINSSKRMKTEIEYKTNC